MAQKLPTTNVFLFDLEKKTDSLYTFTSAKFLTAYNAEGLSLIHI